MELQIELNLQYPVREEECEGKMFVMKTFSLLRARILILILVLISLYAEVLSILGAARTICSSTDVTGTY